VVVRRSVMGGVVLAGPQRHRRYSLEQKIAIVGESYMPGVLIRDVMTRYDLASSVIYTWRKQAREGRLGGDTSGMFAPVAIVEPEASTAIATDAGPAILPEVDVEAASAAPIAQSDGVAGAAIVVALPDGVRNVRPRSPMGAGILIRCGPEGLGFSRCFEFDLNFYHQN
jgi:transposase